MSDAMATVHRLAGLHPQAVLPCPICAAAVKGANLDRHVGKVHPGQAVRAHSVHPSWRGPERLIARPLAAIPILGLVAIAAALGVGREVPDVLIVCAAGAAGLGLIVVGLVLGGAPLFHGRLSVSGDGLVLSHTLGLRRRRLGGIDRVEAGSAYAVTSSGSNAEGVGGTTSQDKAGIYLRLSGGRRYITVRCKQGTGLRKTWTGWTQAGRSRRWHITLDPADFVALQYALFELRRLDVRTN